IRSLQDAGPTAVEARRVLAQQVAASARLNANQLHLGVLDELVEDANCIRAAANTGNHRSWQATFGFEDLLARLPADDAMKVTHHRRVRMCSQHAAQQ